MHIDLTTSDSIPYEQWHRRLSPVTSWLSVSGDLDPDRRLGATQLDGWDRAGVTDVLDVRGEWSDEERVAERVPSMRYWHLPTHDNGGAQDDRWFAGGVAAAHAALEHPGARLLVHCHMGVNRAPSMALRLLLDRGWDAVVALDAIRAARPIAAVAYADDAVVHHHRSIGSTPEVTARDRRRVRQWHRANRIDTATVIRRIRRAEAA